MEGCTGAGGGTVVAGGCGLWGRVDFDFGLESWELMEASNGTVLWDDFLVNRILSHENQLVVVVVFFFLFFFMFEIGRDPLVGDEEDPKQHRKREVLGFEGYWWVDEPLDLAMEERVRN